LSDNKGKIAFALRIFDLCEHNTGTCKFFSGMFTVIATWGRHRKTYLKEKLYKNSETKYFKNVLRIQTNHLQMDSTN